MAAPNFPQGGSLYQQRQGKVIDDPNSEANQKKLLSATRRAKDSEAKAVARQVAAKNNPVNQPGSGILSLPYDISKPLGRPSNLPVRDKSKMFQTTPIGPPRAGQGRQTITTYKPASTARNPYAGFPVAPTKEDLKDKKSYSAFLNKNGAAIDERIAAYQKWERDNKAQYTTRVEDDLDRYVANQEKRQAIIDRVRKDREENEYVAAKVAESRQRPGEKIYVGEGKYDAPGSPGYIMSGEKPPEPYRPPQWHYDVMKKYKSIGEKDSRENKAYVDEYKRQTASGIAFDPMELADEVMKRLNPAPPTRPAIPPMQTPPTGSGRGNYLPPGGVPQSSATPAPVPATPDPVPASFDPSRPIYGGKTNPLPLQPPVPTIPPPATSTPAPVAPITYEPPAPATSTPATPDPATPSPAAPAPEVPYKMENQEKDAYPYLTPENEERLAYPYLTPEEDGVPYSNITNSLPDGVTPAEDAPTSLDPNRPTYGGKTNTLPPGALNPNPLNRPDFNPTPVNPYAPVYSELNGNVNPGQYSSSRPVDPSNTIDLNAAENFDLPSYDTNLTGKRDATPSLPQQNSRGRFAPNGAVEPDLPVASTDGNDNNLNLMPPEMDVYTPVEKKKKKTI